MHTPRYLLAYGSTSLLCEANSRYRDSGKTRERKQAVTDEPKPAQDNALKNTRPRRKYVAVWLLDDEKAEIEGKAAITGLSASAYLRAVGLNQPIRSVVDLKAIADLAKINGDLGRVAGLLKLWLLEKKGQGAPAPDVEKMMVDFRALQQQVTEAMGGLLNDR